MNNNKGAKPSNVEILAQCTQSNLELLKTSVQYREKFLRHLNSGQASQSQANLSQILAAIELSIVQLQGFQTHLEELNQLCRFIESFNSSMDPSEKDRELIAKYSLLLEVNVEESKHLCESLNHRMQLIMQLDII